MNEKHLLFWVPDGNVDIIVYGSFEFLSEGLEGLQVWSQAQNICWLFFYNCL